MPEKTTFDNLPPEIKLSIFKHLPMAQLVKARLISKDWRKLADDNSLWKEKLIILAEKHNFYFEPDLLNQINCQVAFKHLKTLLNNRPFLLMSRFVKKFLLETPNPDFIKQYLDTFNPDTFLANTAPPIEQLKLAIITNNDALIWHLLSLTEPDDKKALHTPVNDTLCGAILYYSLTMIVSLLMLMLFLYDKTQHKTPLITPDKETLSFAAFTGNLAVLKHLLSLTKPHGTPLFIPSLSTLSFAIHSGNMMMIFHLLFLTGPDGSRLLTPDKDTLYFAVTSGNLGLIIYLLSLTKHDGSPLILPNKTTLDSAALSGNLAVLIRLLTLRRADGKTPLLIPNEITLNYARESDNPEVIQLIQSLLDGTIDRQTLEPIPTPELNTEPQHGPSM